LVIATSIVSAFAWIENPSTVAVYGVAALLTLTAAVALMLLWKLHAGQRHADRLTQQLREQQDYTQSLLDALPFPVMAKDRDGAYLQTNIASRRDCGIGAEAIGGTSLALPAPGLFMPGDGEPANRSFHESSLEAIHSGQPQQRELTYGAADGTPRIGLWWDCPIHDGDRGVTGTLGVLLDITRFRQVENEARATEHSLREITRRMPVVVFTLHRGADQQRRVTFMAGDLRALFDVEPQALVETTNILRDWPVFERIHPEDRASVRTLALQTARHPRACSLDFRAYGTGGLRWIHLAMAPQPLADGGVQWTGYLLDTTRINTHNEALRIARDAAERASKAKADFLATMSHEIRTPMNGVVGMLELLARTPLDAEQQELLHAVEDSAGVLLQILNDVLDFSKLEAGNLRLDDAPFDPRTLVDNIVSSVSAQLHRQNLHVQVAVDASLAGMLVGDSVRIRQILLNLLNNAGKFTQQGSIGVNLQVLGDDGASQHLRLSVTDTGIGIAADKQPLLFTPFSQAESWTTRRYGGTGLGLAICRHLMQLMDGSIRLESQPGVGTTVIAELSLPIARREVDRPPGLAGRHAVVRMDSPATAAALAEHLQALGITVERIPPAQPMRTGLAANLLFVDASNASSAASIAAQTVIVDIDSLSRGGPFAQDEVIHLGANPLKWQSVTRACMLALEAINPRPRKDGLSTSAASAVVAASSKPHPCGRILVAEDHPVGQALARRQLALLGWPCDVVGDGRAAYEALLAGSYAMLVTDCQMPAMDGYELAAAWRRHEAEQGHAHRLPIVAMTASALDGEAVRCHAAGMDDYLSKPVQLRELERMVQSWMPPHAPPEAVAPANASAISEAGFGAAEAGLKRMMIDTGHADLGLLGQAVAGRDVHAAAQRLHRLLGALQLFTDAPAMAEGRILLEGLQGEQATQTLQRLPDYLPSLRELLDRLEPPRPHETGE
jgi:signal transduction histidine kinase/ActR/RegA family two-component response regulator